MFGKKKLHNLFSHLSVLFPNWLDSGKAFSLLACNLNTKSSKVQRFILGLAIVYLGWSFRVYLMPVHCSIISGTLSDCPSIILMLSPGIVVRCDIFGEPFPSSFGCSSPTSCSGVGAFIYVYGLWDTTTLHCISWIWTWIRSSSCSFSCSWGQSENLKPRPACSRCHWQKGEK